MAYACVRKLVVVMNPISLGSIVMTMSVLIMVARSSPNTSIKFVGCNVNKYSQNEAYGGNVAYVLADLMNVTPNAGYNYYTHSPSASAVCYGHGTCSTALSYNDCADCLTAARAAVLASCPNSVGGDVQMLDCTIRYENYSF